VTRYLPTFDGQDHATPVPGRSVSRAPDGGYCYSASLASGVRVFQRADGRLAEEVEGESLAEDVARYLGREK